MKMKKERVTKKKLSSNKITAILLIALVAVIVSGFVLAQILMQAPEVKFPLKAAIIDQLGDDAQNPDFNETGMVASMLKNVGFNVSYHRSETANVAFFKELAKYDYGLIILRTHAATRKDETIVDIFTSEGYDEDKYVSEQENGLLTSGYYSWMPEKFYFAITPKFIENLEGYFPKSIVIAMGCNTLNETCTEMAKAFTKRGAKIYVGWTGLVGYSHTDNETIKLLTRFLIENKTLDNAIRAVKPDPYYGSTMKYYPPEAGNLRISDLILETKVSINLQPIVNSLTSLLVCGTDITKSQIENVRRELE